MYSLYLLQNFSGDVHDHNQAVVQVHKKKSVSGRAFFLKYVPWEEHLCHNVKYLHQKREFVPVSIRLQTGFYSNLLGYELTKLKQNKQTITGFIVTY